MKSTPQRVSAALALVIIFWVFEAGQRALAAEGALYIPPLIANEQTNSLSTYLRL